MMFLLPQWPAAIACNVTDEAVIVAVFSQFTHHTSLTTPHSPLMLCTWALLCSSCVCCLFLFVLRFRVNAALEQQSNRAVEQQQQQHFAKWTGWRSLIAKFNCRYAACAAHSLLSLCYWLSVCCSRNRHLCLSAAMLRASLSQSCSPSSPLLCSASLPACLSPHDTHVLTSTFWRQVAWPTTVLHWSTQSSWVIGESFLQYWQLS